MTQPQYGGDRVGRPFLVVAGVLVTALVAYFVVFAVLDPFGDPTDYDKVPFAHGTTFTSAGAPVVYDVLADRIVSRAIEDWVEKKRPDVRSPKKIEFASSYSPRFSPDGTKVAFIGTVTDLPREADVVSALYVMEVGSDTATPVSSHGFDPVFSPDGKRMAYTDVQDEVEAVWVVNVDGKEKRRLTDGPGSTAGPAFSPDGKRIAFSSDRDGNDEIYVMTVEGKDVKRLTRDDATDLHPAFSPDGGHIVFDRNADPPFDSDAAPTDEATDAAGAEKASDIHVMDADGKNVERLTDEPGPDHSPSYSPDGRLIVYTHEGQGQVGAYVMSADGSAQKVLFPFPTL